MAHLVVDQANLRSERDVVKEELRQRIFSQPYGRIFYTLMPKYTYIEHPYARPMAGTIADLDAATLQDVRAFHEAFYRPDNAVLLVSGSFTAKQVDGWIDSYFGVVERPRRPLTRPHLARAGAQGGALGQRLCAECPATGSDSVVSRTCVVGSGN